MKKIIILALLFFSHSSYSMLESILSELSLEEEEPEVMVYMPSDFIRVMTNLPTRSAQKIRDLIEYINMGYTVAPLKEVSEAIEIALRSDDISISNRTIIREYKEDILNGNAIIAQESALLNDDSLAKVMQILSDLQALKPTLPKPNITPEEANDENDEDECAICFESLTKHPIITTACKHTFHSSCLNAWKHGSCPLCRRSINQS